MRWFGTGVPWPHDRTRQGCPPDPRPTPGRPGDLRRQGPGDVLPADRAGAPACGRPERAGDPHRRRRLRRVGAFGGPCHTSVAEQLAANGLKFTRFHTVPCSPTRRGAVGTQPPLGRHGRDHRDRDVGADTASPVADDYPDPSTFTGRIDWVQLDVGEDDHDHLISPEERMRMAMTAVAPDRGQRKSRPNSPERRHASMYWKYAAPIG